MTVPYYQITAQLTPEQKHDLENLWLDLSKTLELPTAAAKEIFDQISTHYSSPKRKYHNLAHLYSIFKNLSFYDNLISNASTLHLAIWFHDIIYDTRKKDNELQSALFFKTILADYLTAYQVNTVYGLIESTSNHHPLSYPDNELLLDLDLLILATHWATYQQYASAIRQEYKQYPKLLYNIGRKKVLQSFLKRDKIYFTPTIYQQFENQARQNLLQETNQL